MIRTTCSVIVSSAIGAVNGFLCGVRLVNASVGGLVMFKRLICAIGVAGSVLLPTPASAQMT